jgi:hypothetical protein
MGEDVLLALQMVGLNRKMAHSKTATGVAARYIMVSLHPDDVPSPIQRIITITLTRFFI